MPTPLEDLSVDCGDVVISEYDAAFCRDSVLITNGTEGTITLNPGYPVTDGAPTVAAGIAAATGIVLKRTTLAPDEAKLIPILKRGPAIINQDKLPAADIAAAAFNMTNFAARLVTLGFVVRREPPKQATQTT